MSDTLTHNGIPLSELAFIPGQKPSAPPSAFPHTSAQTVSPTQSVADAVSAGEPIPDAPEAKPFQNAVETVEEDIPELTAGIVSRFMQPLPPAEIVTKIFTLNGVKYKVKFNTAGATQAGELNTLVALMAGVDPVTRKPLPCPYSIQPHNAPRFTIEDRTYLWQLRVLARVAPAMSLDEWAMLGAAVGPFGRTGEDGMFSVINYALTVNRLSEAVQAEDEQGAGEELSPASG